MNAVRKDTYCSDYLVIFCDLIRDVWNAKTGEVWCDGGLVNDPMDCSRVNVEWDLHDDDLDTVVLRATRDLEEGEEIFVDYGGNYWCRNKHGLYLQLEAVRRYRIDIRTSTRDTHGDWKVLRTMLRY